MTLEWTCLIFVFMLGGCIGSFLNVVIYRLPRDKSLVSPGSSCPSCGVAIAFYDNIPLLSWLLLRAKCRKCKAKISGRYFVVELLTAIVFSLMFVLYFIYHVRRFEIDGIFGVEVFLNGGWFFYTVHIVLLAALIASSAIDMELWIIPLSVCWFVTLFGIICCGVAPMLIDPAIVWTYKLFPAASANIGALAAGGVIGLLIALGGLGLGIIKGSYDSDEQEGDASGDDAQGEPKRWTDQDEPDYNHRFEVLKEILFLLPIILCGIGALILTQRVEVVDSWWAQFSQRPVVTGVLGSLWGYFVGCGVVWATRILGTLMFGKEAMGLGDVHLMGAAGAVLGWLPVTVAFFIAPFFGLVWAGYQFFLKKTRQIPYGPFLSMGILTVMIFHDWVRVWLSNIYLGR